MYHTHFGKVHWPPIYVLSWGASIDAELVGVLMSICAIFAKSGNLTAKLFGNSWQPCGMDPSSTFHAVDGGA